jgi:UDP:flavonoid glycosyltransferase YjiC (YdhE family)
MTHFGILCLEATGHLNTMFPLGRELQRRGHCVTVFSGSGGQTKAQAAGFSFCDIYSAGDHKPSREAQTLPAKPVFTPK